MTVNVAWQVLSTEHRAKQVKAIPPEWLLQPESLDKLRGVNTEDEGKLIKLDAVSKSGLLDEKDLDLTENSTAREVLDRLSRGQLASEDVVRAYCKRASLAHQLTNCLTEIWFAEAIERAKWLDNQRKKTGRVVGPLHGLPISIKDSFVVKGKHATAGYVEFLRRPVPEENSALVNLLLDAGAVIYCKTNVPQTMMTADSENNVFGRTLNPHNTKLTAGGSTGGEGALVAFRGSILGVGTDIAGSIRIPSLCCGVYGFKPTIDRIPFGGQISSPHPGSILGGIKPAVGPVTNSVGDLSLFMDVVMRQRPWKYDATAIDIPWRSLPHGETNALVVGVLPEDPEYPLHPPVQRTLESAASALEEAGHQVVRLPIDPSRSVSLGGRIGFQYFFLMEPESASLSEEIGEPLVASVARGVHPFTKGGFPVSPELDRATQFADLNSVRDAYAEMWQKTWLDHNLDVILAPGAISTAVPHDTYGNPMYTLMWNVLDYPAGNIPYSFSSKDEDPEPQAATADFDADYVPEATHGAPCSVQVIASRFRDEECLRAMEIINAVLHKDN
ncbi:hypothetical protein NW754_002344 [Fusarium falciforme]|nr:hypothetical protein NW754_002344 [Fusarium falciforme]